MVRQAQNLQSLSPEASQRVALLVEYCGSGFYGSQYQPNRPTLQLALEEALGKLNLTTSAVSFAGRTDAGVNAHGQVAHVDITPDSLKNVPDLAAALNAVLPDSVSVKAVALDAGHAFNSRRNATAKWYRYVIYNAPNRSVWMPAGAARVKTCLDVDAMDQAARMLLGTHNFKSFKGADTDVVDDICTVYHAGASRNGDIVTFDIVANRFLYKMVRNLTGQLLAIGNIERPLNPETMLKVLAKQDRTQAAAIARPEGLSLMAIRYEPPFNFFEQDPLVQKLNQHLNNNPMESMQNENLFRKAS